MANFPQKHIHDEKDMAIFARSPAHTLLLSSLEQFCLSVKGVLTPREVSPGLSIQKVVDLLHAIECELDLIEPIHQPMRFGNKAFRLFHARLVDVSDGLVRSCFLSVDDDKDKLVCELVPYLLDSFGNSIRIDYGTGHEMSFFAFLVILQTNVCIHENDSSQIVTVIFAQYLRLVRKIILKYSMEPAGSHGVWGLDDFHHLAFLFGSAQLIGSSVPPRNYFSTVKDSNGPDSLMGEALLFLKKTKCMHAPFSQVSPILSDLLNRSESWSVCCYALLQMYKSEVLSKKPVIQHFLFGNTFRWTTPTTHVLV